MKIPGKATISNRTSTMASQFARARAPYVVPTNEQFSERYCVLGINPEAPECIYCGGTPTEWDHLRPMVSGSKWTGYFTEIANLVPACGKCNQSRGSKPIDQWMRSRAPWSPFLVFQARDGLPPDAALLEVDRRIALIERALEMHPPTRIAIDLSDQRERDLEACRLELNDLLYRAETIAADLRRYYQSEALDPALPASQHLG